MNIGSMILRYLRWRKRPSINNLDRKLAKYLDFREGFFIEAGANDGYAQSNTYFLEKKRGWHGLLIEGIPELYKTCKFFEKVNSFLISQQYEMIEQLSSQDHLYRQNQAE